MLQTIEKPGSAYGVPVAPRWDSAQLPRGRPGTLFRIFARQKRGPRDPSGGAPAQRLCLSHCPPRMLSGCTRAPLANRRATSLLAAVLAGAHGREAALDEGVVALQAIAAEVVLPFGVLDGDRALDLAAAFPDGLGADFGPGANGVGIAAFDGDVVLGLAVANEAAAAAKAALRARGGHGAEDGREDDHGGEAAQGEAAEKAETQGTHDR